MKTKVDVANREEVGRIKLALADPQTRAFEEGNWTWPKVEWTCPKQLDIGQYSSLWPEVS